MLLSDVRSAALRGDVALAEERGRRGERDAVWSGRGVRCFCRGVLICDCPCAPRRCGSCYRVVHPLRTRAA
eukprot:5383523-Pleurochrysis_carterae.AAC.2